MKLTFYLKLLLIFLVVIWGFFIYLGSYWENWPIFDRISGPMRYQQYVSKVIPENVKNIKGGYAGFPRGSIKTYFDYQHEKELLSDKWILFESRDLGINFEGLEEGYPKIYTNQNRIFILLNEELKKGILYKPAG